jgi:hypothetical protein
MESICFLPSAFCFLPSADCLLHLGEVGWRGLLAGTVALVKMSQSPGKERTNNFKK